MTPREWEEFERRRREELRREEYRMSELRALYRAQAISESKAGSAAAVSGGGGGSTSRIESPLPAIPALPDGPKYTIQHGDFAVPGNSIAFFGPDIAGGEFPFYTFGNIGYEGVDYTAYWSNLASISPFYQLTLFDSTNPLNTLTFGTTVDVALDAFGPGVNIAANTNNGDVSWTVGIPDDGTVLVVVANTYRPTIAEYNFIDDIAYNSPYGIGEMGYDVSSETTNRTVSQFIFNKVDNNGADGYSALLPYVGNTLYIYERADEANYLAINPENLLSLTDASPLSDTFTLNLDGYSQVWTKQAPAKGSPLILSSARIPNSIQQQWFPNTTWDGISDIGLGEIGFVESEWANRDTTKISIRYVNYNGQNDSDELYKTLTSSPKITIVITFTGNTFSEKTFTVTSANVIGLEQDIWVMELVTSDGLWPDLPLLDGNPVSIRFNVP